MKNPKLLQLPNGASVRPFMIAVTSATDNGVVLLSSTTQIIGFIEVDGDKYDAEKLKLLIMKLLYKCVEDGQKFKQIDWESVFYSCRREVPHID